MLICIICNMYIEVFLYMLQLSSTVINCNIIKQTLENINWACYTRPLAHTFTGYNNADRINPYLNINRLAI